MSSYQLHHPVSISSLLPSPRPPLRGGLPAASPLLSTWLADWKPADTAVNMSLIIGVACRHDTGQMRRRIHACHTRRRINACRHDTRDSQAGKHPSRSSQARGGMRPPSWKAPEKAWPVCV